MYIAVAWSSCSEFLLRDEVSIVDQTLQNSISEDLWMICDIVINVDLDRPVDVLCVQNRANVQAIA